MSAHFLRGVDFWIELAASSLTLAGVWFGSTTALGAAFYLASLVFWYWVMIRKALWGLLPLNVATTIIASANLWMAK